LVHEIKINIENTKVNVSSSSTPAQTPIVNKAKNAVPSQSNSNVMAFGV
jgi:hypothetical protein